MKEKKQINIEIGGRVKHERELAGLTQERFSELLGLGEKHISAIECGAVGLSLSSLQRICSLLSIPGDVILFGRSEKNDVHDLTARLEQLSPEQFKIANDVLCKLLEAFALNK